MCTNNTDFVFVVQSCGNLRYIPTGCSDPTCIECEKHKARLRQQAWLPIIQEMDTPRLITLTERSQKDLEAAWLTFNEDFRKFMDLSLGKVNLKRLRSLADEWLESHHAELIKSGDMTEVKAIEEKQRWNKLNDRFFRNVKPKREDGKPTRLRDLIGPGFVSREVTYSEAGWHVHAHMVTDGQFIPHPALVAAWMTATKGKGEIVDIRLLDVATETGKRKSMSEVIKYLSKTWEIPEDKKDELRKVAKGKNRIKPLGNARPVIPDPKPCKCGDPNCKAHVIGEGTLIRKEKNIVEFEASLSDHLPEGLHPIEMDTPPGKEPGTYRLVFTRQGDEWTLLYLIHYRNLRRRNAVTRQAQAPPTGDRWSYFRQLQAERMTE